MPWNPDSGDNLSAPAINVMHVEATAMALWAEFLAGWFNGQPHVVRGVSTPLPQIVGLTFQEQDIPQPLEGLYLHLTTETKGRAKRRVYGDTSWVMFEDIIINAWFRARVKAPRADRHNSRSLVRWGSDSLYAILTSFRHCFPLTRRGIQRMRPRPPKLITGQDTAMRQLQISCWYNYPADELLSGDQILSTDTAGYLLLGTNTRVGPNGLEYLADDDNWYGLNVVPPDGVTLLAPTLSITEV